MRVLIAAATICGASGAAHADIPFFSATCPGAIAVRAATGGPVTIDGGEAVVLSESKYAFTARRGAVTVVVTIKPDASLSVTYTGPGGEGGVCLVGTAGQVDHDRQL